MHKVEVSLCLQWELSHSSGLVTLYRSFISYHIETEHKYINSSCTMHISAVMHQCFQNSPVLAISNATTQSIKCRTNTAGWPHCSCADGPLCLSHCECSMWPRLRHFCVRLQAHTCVWQQNYGCGCHMLNKGFPFSICSKILILKDS